MTYYVTWRTRRTLYFPIIPLLALQIKIRTMLDVLYKTDIPAVSVHYIWLLKLGSHMADYDELKPKSKNLPMCVKSLCLCVK